MEYIIIRIFNHKTFKTIYYVQDYEIYKIINKEDEPYNKILKDLGYEETQTITIPKEYWLKIKGNEFGGIYYDNWENVDWIIEQGKQLSQEQLRETLEKSFLTNNTSSILRQEIENFGWQILEEFSND